MKLRNIFEKDQTMEIVQEINFECAYITCIILFMISYIHI